MSILKHHTDKGWEGVGTYIQSSGEVWEDVPLNQAGIITNGVLDKDTDYLEFDFDKPYKKMKVKIDGSGTAFVVANEHYTSLALNNNIDAGGTNCFIQGNNSLGKSGSYNAVFIIESKGDDTITNFYKNGDYSIADGTFSPIVDPNTPIYWGVSPYKMVERLSIALDNTLANHFIKAGSKITIQGVAL